MEPYSVGWQTGPAVARAVIDEVKKVICGKDEIVERVMIAILAGGHVLLEDMLGKRRWRSLFRKRCSLSISGFNLRRMLCRAM